MAELMEAKVFQTYDGQSCVTTMNYLSTGLPAAVSRSFALLAALGMIDGITPDVGNVRAAWLNCVHSSLVITEVQIKAVYDVVDFYTLPLAVNNAGIGAGEAESSFVSLGFQTNRVRSDIRRGNRRLAGVDRSSIDSFGLIETVTLGLMTTLAENFSNILTYDDEGNTLSFTPVIVRKELYEPSPGKKAYQYYETELEQASWLAAGVEWTPKTRVTSQVSRKRGRGI